MSLSICPKCLFSIMTIKGIELVKDMGNSDRWGLCLEGPYRCRETQAWLQTSRTRGQPSIVQGAIFQEERVEMGQKFMDARNQRGRELWKGFGLNVPPTPTGDVETSGRMESMWHV